MKKRFTLPVILWLLAVASCLLVLTRTTFTADMSAFLPKNPTAEQALLVDQLKEGVLSRTLLIGIEGADAATRADLSRGLAQRMQQSGLFVAVNNGGGEATELDRKLLFANRYLLSPSVAPQRFTTQGLHDAIGNSIDLLGSPAGMMLKNLLPHDPTGEMVELFGALTGGGDNGGNSTPDTQFGAWSSRDGQRAILMAQTRAAGSDTDGQQQAIASIRNAFEAAKQSHEQPNQASLPFQGGGQEGDGVTSTTNQPHRETLKPHPHPGPPPFDNAQDRLEGEGEQSHPVAAHDDAHLLISGAPAFSVDARATIEAEVHRLAFISAAGIVILLLLAYRSFTALVFGLLPVVSGALAGIAAVSLGFGSVHGITIGFGTTLIGEAVDYTIYYFVQSGASADNNQQRWIERFWPTIRLGVLTSICGFVALLFSGFPGLAQLGLYSIAGLVSAAAVTRFVLPTLCPAGIGLRPLGNGAIGRAAGKVIDHLGKLGRGRWLVAVLALLAVGILWHKQDQLWSDSLSSLSPISPAAQALDMSLRNDLGAPDLRYLVVVSRGDKEAALAAAEQAGAVLDTLVADGTIAGYNSAARFLPSRTTQQRRRDALPPRDELAQRLDAATKDLPLRAAKLTPFLDDTAAARAAPLIDREQLSGSSLALAVDSLLMQRAVKDALNKSVRAEPVEAQPAPILGFDKPVLSSVEGLSPNGEGLNQRFNTWTALLPLRAVTGSEIDPARIQQALAAAHLDGGLCLDLAGESTRLYKAYLHEAILLSLAGFVAIALLLAVALRSPRRALRVLMPLAAAVLLVLAGLALAGEKLTLLHLVGILLIVAVGSNYALFFDRPSEAKDGAVDPQTLSSLLLANVATLIGFGTLAIAKVPVLHAIGVTVGPGAVLALLLAAMLARPAKNTA